MNLHLGGVDVPGAAVHRDHVALTQHALGGADGAGCDVDPEVRGSANRRLPRAAGHHGRV